MSLLFCNLSSLTVTKEYDLALPDNVVSYEFEGPTIDSYLDKVKEESKKVEDNLQVIVDKDDYKRVKKKHKKVRDLKDDVVIEVDEDDLDDINVEVYPDRVYSALVSDSLPLIHADLFWNEGFDGSGIKVAILDTGLKSSLFNVVDQEDFMNTGSFEDNHGHGTHIGGIVVSVAPDVLLMNAKVLDDSGSGTTSSIVSGIYWAVDNGANIISMSLGAPYSTPDPLIDEAIGYAVDNGVTVIIASGNCGSGCNGFVGVTVPGRNSDVITVGAVDNNLEHAYFSGGEEIGSVIKPDVVAPGVDITSNDLDGFATKSGTSMATPFVAGVAALLLERNNSLNHFEVKSLLEENALDLGISGKDVEFGSGFVDLGLFLTEVDTNVSVNDTVDVNESVVNESVDDDSEENESVDENITFSEDIEVPGQNSNFNIPRNHSGNYTIQTTIGGALCSDFPDYEWTSVVNTDQKCYTNDDHIGVAYQAFELGTDCIWDEDQRYLGEKKILNGERKCFDVTPGFCYYRSVYYCDDLLCSCTDYESIGCGSSYGCDSDQLLRRRTCENNCDEEEVCVNWIEIGLPGCPECEYDSDCDSNEECREGECVYCLDHNSYKCYNNDVYWYDGCNNREEKKEECGSNGCDSWGNNYCKSDGNVYHFRTCYNRGCSGSSCYSNSYNEEVKVSDCTYGCSNGICLEGGYDHIDLIDYYIDPSYPVVKSGESFTLEYKISNSGNSIKVGLGASIKDSNGVEYNDQANDDIVTVSSGTYWYSRTFDVGDFPVDEYDVIWGIHQVNANNEFDGAIEFTDYSNNLVTVIECDIASDCGDPAHCNNDGYKVWWTCENHDCFVHADNCDGGYCNSGECIYDNCDNECSSTGYFCEGNRLYECERVGNCYEKDSVDYCRSPEICKDDYSSCQVNTASADLQIEDATSGVDVYKQPGDILIVRLDKNSNGNVVLNYDSSAFSVESGCSGTFYLSSDKTCQFIVLDNAINGDYEIGINGGNSETVKIIRYPKTLFITDRSKLYSRFSGQSNDVDSLLKQTYQTASENYGIVYDLDEYLYSVFGSYSSYDEDLIEPDVSVNYYSLEIANFVKKKCKDCKNIIIVGDDYVVPHYRRDIDMMHWFIINWGEDNYNIFTDLPYIQKSTKTFSELDTIMYRQEDGKNYEGKNVLFIKPNGASSEINTQINNLKTILTTKYNPDFEEIVGNNVVCNDPGFFSQFNGRTLVVIGNEQNNRAFKCFPFIGVLEDDDAAFIEVNPWDGRNYAVIVNTNDANILEGFNEIIEKGHYIELKSESAYFFHVGVQVTTYAAIGTAVTLAMVGSGGTAAPLVIASLAGYMDAAADGSDAVDTCFINRDDDSWGNGWGWCGVSTAFVIIPFVPGGPFKTVLKNLDSTMREFIETGLTKLDDYFGSSTVDNFIRHSDEAVENTKRFHLSLGANKVNLNALDFDDLAEVDQLRLIEKTGICEDSFHMTEGVKKVTVVNDLERPLQDGRIIASRASYDVETGELFIAREYKNINGEWVDVDFENTLRLHIPHEYSHNQIINDLGGSDQIIKNVRTQIPELDEALAWKSQEGFQEFLADNLAMNKFDDYEINDILDELLNNPTRKDIAKRYPNFNGDKIAHYHALAKKHNGDVQAMENLLNEIAQNHPGTVQKIRELSELYLRNSEVMYELPHKQAEIFGDIARKTKEIGVLK